MDISIYILTYINFKMSLLYKTISSFFPTEVQCTFVGEPWFLENYELQLDVLRLCEAGFACVLFTQIRDRFMFKMHVACCMQRYIDQDYYLDSPHYRAKFTKYLTSSIPEGDYLLTRSWFCNDISSQVNVYLIEINACSSMINVVAGDFKEHIESVMETIVWCYDIYGKYTRTLIHQGSCSAFFNHSKLSTLMADNIHKVTFHPVNYRYYYEVEAEDDAEYDEYDEYDDDDFDEGDPDDHYKTKLNYDNASDDELVDGFYPV